jgi:hypothetical protein
VNAVAATSDSFRLTGLVVLPGIEAPSAARSPFIMRSFDQELVVCQRYYEKSYDYAVKPGTAVGAGGGTLMGYGTNQAGAYVGSLMSFKVVKRAMPTTSVYDNAGTNGKLSTYSAGWVNGTAISSGPSATTTAVNVATNIGCYFMSCDFSADARL